MGKGEFKIDEFGKPSENRVLLIDYVGGTDPIYVGEAKPGTAIASTGWRIFKLAYDDNGNVTSKKWADGANSFTKKWSLRTGYAYS